MQNQLPIINVNETYDTYDVSTHCSIQLEASQ